MSRHTQRRSEGVAGALILHLCLYCGVAACLAFGLYALFQPSHRINPGLAAYKPPPATVIDYGHPIVRPQLAFVQPAASADPLTPEPETTGRSSPAPQPDASHPLPQPPRQASKSNQTRDIGSSGRRRHNVSEWRAFRDTTVPERRRAGAEKPTVSLESTGAK
jgi:hypothetical protein